MFDSIFDILWLVICGMFMFGMSIPVRVFTAPSANQKGRANMTEMLLSGLAFVGLQLLPVVVVFTNLFDFAAMALPVSVRWTGVALFAVAVNLAGHAYWLLGQNWFNSANTRGGYQLVTHGPFSVIRHPVYAGMWLWALAQPLVLDNWLSGLAGVGCYLPIYLMRIKHEEQMLIDHFGDEYRDYMDGTGRIFPRLSG